MPCYKQIFPHNTTFRHPFHYIYFSDRLFFKAVNCFFMLQPYSSISFLFFALHTQILLDAPCLDFFSDFGITNKCIIKGINLLVLYYAFIPPFCSDKNPEPIYKLYRFIFRLTIVSSFLFLPFWYWLMPHDFFFNCLQ